jgi:hypothetical protein
MKLLSFAKICILMALAINYAEADVDRVRFTSDEEIDRDYLDDPQILESQGANAQRQYLKKYEQSISDTKGLPRDQAIQILEPILIKIYTPNRFQVTERIAAYDKAQAAFLAIPGYSDYYIEQIEQSRAKAIAPGAEYRDTRNYDENRNSIFEVMANLPGPETIKLLGHYLDDLRDPREDVVVCEGGLRPQKTLSDEEKENRRVREKPFDAAYKGTNASYATVGLYRIGLRNSPTAQVDTTNWNIVEHIAHSKAWWEKVKAGQIPFSFVRQTVEYRFRPDGTWETTQLPISVLERDKSPAAPAQPPSTVRPDKRSSTPLGPLANTNTNATSLISKPWPAILGAVLACILGAWYFLRRRKAA